ncbi:hypothetical protein FKM82_017889 [Ascaphus truei]
MSNRRLVELFYDVVSPYSWLGFEVLCRYRSIWNVDIRLRPAFLGGIMSASGNSPPALVPKKAAYMVKDLERQAEFYQVPVRQPKDFFQVVIKKGSLSAMRFVTAVQMSHPEFLEQVSRELWLRIWSEDKDITEPDSLLEASTFRVRHFPFPHPPQKNYISVGPGPTFFKSRVTGTRPGTRLTG